MSEIHPAVISASRRTDIPAFYADWMLRQLERGFTVVPNPRYPENRSKVFFDEVRAFVFWTKNPAPFAPVLDRLDEMNVGYYFQFTLNGYSPKIEPGIPSLEERIESFSRLSERCPVVWRYDPVIMRDGDLAVSGHIDICGRLMDRLGDRAEKLVFSFVDMYGSVSGKLAGTGLRAPDLREMREFSGELVRLRDRIAPDLRLATCAESGEYEDVEHNRCVDPDLLAKVNRKPAPPRGKLFSEAKDSGQRQGCGCAKSADIGSYLMPCRHHCSYCYAGHKTGHRPVPRIFLEKAARSLVSPDRPLRFSSDAAGCWFDDIWTGVRVREKGGLWEVIRYSGKDAETSESETVGLFDPVCDDADEFFTKTREAPCDQSSSCGSPAEPAGKNPGQRRGLRP